MSRLIDADELKTAFPCGEYVRTESVRATIDSMPTIEAEPVRHGKWTGCKGSDGKDYRKCSVCLHTQNITGLLNFCPVCGANMDLDEVNDETN